MGVLSALNKHARISTPPLPLSFSSLAHTLITRLLRLPFLRATTTSFSTAAATASNSLVLPSLSLHHLLSSALYSHHCRFNICYMRAPTPTSCSHLGNRTTHTHTHTHTHTNKQTQHTLVLDRTTMISPYLTTLTVLPR
jgi:hypothetical protein